MAPSLTTTTQPRLGKDSPNAAHCLRPISVRAREAGVVPAATTAVLQSTPRPCSETARALNTLTSRALALKTALVRCAPEAVNRFCEGISPSSLRFTARSSMASRHGFWVSAAYIPLAVPLFVHPATPTSPLSPVVIFWTAFMTHLVTRPSSIWAVSLTAQVHHPLLLYIRPSPTAQSYTSLQRVCRRTRSYHTPEWRSIVAPRP